MEKPNKVKNEFLRHMLSTIVYRFQKSVRGALENFGEFNAGKGTRTPSEIITHMYYVLNATKIYIQTETAIKEKPKTLNLEQEIERFNAELKSIDNVLAKKELEMTYSKKILQGPFADILTHIGQISMLSRLNDNQIEGEDFSAASIEIGSFSYF